MIEVTDGLAVYMGADDEPFGLPNTVLAAALVRANVSAGVVDGLETVVVNIGERFPAVNVDTPPPPPPEPHGLAAVVSSPPVPTWTQSPGVRVLSVTDVTRIPLKVLRLAVKIFGLDRPA